MGAKSHDRSSMKLTRADLYSLEEYAEKRNELRSKVMAHKENRIVGIGPHARLYFEDRLTMQYQIQEMLRVERIFEPDAIEEELTTYNPLIPDGSNWKATFMLEYDDPSERRQQLAKLIGIENQVWVKVNGCEPVLAIADEDLERTNEDKTSSVHFLRFELTPEMVDAAKRGASIEVGIDHDHYRYSLDPIPKPVRDSLICDLEG